MHSLDGRSFVISLRLCRHRSPSTLQCANVELPSRLARNLITHTDEVKPVIFGFFFAEVTAMAVLLGTSLRTRNLVVESETTEEKKVGAG